MCLIALACHAVPGFPLVLLANRDEQYARPSAPVDWWDDQPGILGGRDLQAGGGWLAIHRDGRLAAVTNVRDGRRYAGRRSRGELVTHFLTSEEPLTDFAGWLSRHGGDFAPFNLVFGRVDALYVYHSPTRELRRLTRGIHGISNGRPDAGWPKVERLNSHLRGLARLPAEDSVFEWLADREEAPLAQLPNTGVGAGLERLLSPVFIAGRDYGTRASSFLVVDAQGRVRFTEQSWHAGRPDRRRPFQFRLEPRSCPSPA